jgi:hypothetical protein
LSPSPSFRIVSTYPGLILQPLLYLVIRSVISPTKRMIVQQQAVCLHPLIPGTTIYALSSQRSENLTIPKTHKMTDNCDRATAHSAFFTVLPLEVRISILTAAFGGRTVHVQQCRSWEVQPPQAQYTAQSMAVGNTRQWLRGMFAKRTKEKREQARPLRRDKRWCGCICYRLPDVAVGTSPAADSCLADLKPEETPRDGRWSCLNPPEVPPELAIGAIGWLLTCRRA